MQEVQAMAPKHIRPATSATIYDIAVLINAVYQQNIEPTQAGRVPKRISNKLDPLLKGQERLNYQDNNDYIEMLLLILRDMRIVQIVEPPFADMKARIEPGVGIGAWSQLSLEEQTRLMIEQWKTNAHWIDPAGVNYDPWSWNSYYREIKNGRQALIKQLSQYQAGKWYTLESFLEQMWKEQPLELRLRQSYMSKSEQKKLQTQRESWMQSDGEVYTGMFEFALSELGLVELGYNGEGQSFLAGSNPYAFMLTELGASIIEEQSSAKTPSRSIPDKTTEKARTLIVQPNFELLILLPDMPTLYSILPFVQVKQIDIASSFKLSSPALLRGLSAGKTIEQIVQTLAELSTKELPQNVIYTLNDWAKQYAEARISQAIIIEVPGETISNQLCANAKLKKYGIRQITPGMLMVNGDINLQELRTALDKEGIAIRLHGQFNTTDTD